MASVELLNQYLSSPLTFDEMASTLTDVGFPVEVRERKEIPWTHVIVARVSEMKPHPNAERLRLLKLTDGTDTYDVVCGASNMSIDDKVALARPGAKLPGGIKIKRSKIRGELSDGMCCSAEELGLPKEGDGILILDRKAPLGRPLEEFLFDGDVRFDVEITANRGDVLGFIGLCREIAAKRGLKLKRPDVSVTPPRSSFPVQIENSEDCWRYAAALVRGIKMGPSPDWLVKSLEKGGLRSINCIVDVTNFVLLETAQPIHAFDASRIEGGEITVRRATEGERLRTLVDDRTIDLAPDDLVISDRVRSLALAGIVGGEDSSITDRTESILIEVAAFNPVLVRLGSRRHDLRTEAAQRFERGVDLSAIEWTLKRTVDLILQVAGGRWEAMTDLYPRPASERVIEFDAAEIESAVGAKIKSSRAVEILSALEFDARLSDGGLLKVQVPGHRRADVSQPADVIEEVARVNGYDQIPLVPVAAVLPIDLKAKARSSELDEYPRIRWEREIREYMASVGFQEAITMSMISSEFLNRLTNDTFTDAVRLREPLSSDQDVLRPSLFPSLLSAVQRNLDRGAREVRLFEIGTIFQTRDDSPIPAVDQSPLRESTRFAAVLARSEIKSLWKDEQRRVTVFDLKGIVDRIFQYYRIDGISYRSIQGAMEGFYHPGVMSGIYHRQRPIGHLGAFHPRISQILDVSEEIFGVELEIDLLYPVIKPPHFRPFSEFPPMWQDVSFIVDESITNQMVIDVIDGAEIPLIQDRYCFDVFYGSRLPKGKKSMAYSILYHHPNRTLTQEEVDESHARLVTLLQEKLDISLRE